LFSYLCVATAPPRAVLTKKYEDGLIFEEGDVIRLKINFTGRPRPEVTWFHENTQLDSSERREIETGEDYTILKVSPAVRADRGEYSVRLQSNLGEDAASFLVTVASKYFDYFYINPIMRQKKVTFDKNRDEPISYFY